MQNSVSTILKPIQFSDPQASKTPWEWLTYYSPPIRAFEFFSGVLIAQVFINQQLNPKKISKKCVWWNECAIYGSIIWCLFVVFFSSKIHSSFIQTLRPNFIFAPAILTILYIICRSDTYLTKLMSSPVMMFFGEISYSVYLMQTVVFVALVSTFPSHTTACSILRFLYTILVSTALGYGLYHIVEAPARWWIKKAVSKFKY